MTTRPLAQALALLFGLAFVVVGVLGFIPGITTNLGDIEFAGNDSPSELLGLFQVSVLHNIVHLLFGLAGIALSRTTPNALMYLLYSGVIYVVLTVYGFFVGGDDDANFVPVNNADDWLHLVLAVALLGSWYISRGEQEYVSDRPITPPPPAP
jgi:Domain of unknown function (DUF4383)